MAEQQTRYGDPQQLEHFFTNGEIFGFHDQNDDDHTFTYGYCQPQLYNTKDDTANFSVMNSNGGGYVTLIQPARTEDERQLKAYLAEQFGLTESKINLKFITPQTELAMNFPAVIDPIQATVPFEQTKLTTTHSEGSAIVAALQQQEDQVFIIVNNVFSVQAKASLFFEADNALLQAAVEEKVSNQEDLEQFLRDQIANESLDLRADYTNSPSDQIKQEAEDGLFEMAGFLILSTITNARSASDLPDPYSQKVTFSHSYAQNFRFTQKIDLAKALTSVPIDQIVTFMNSTLPEPTRTAPKPDPDGPGPTPGDKRDSCTVSLGFSPDKLSITDINVKWGKVTEAMSWPDFPPVELTQTDGPDKLTVTTSFANSMDFEAELAYAKAVSIGYPDIGYQQIEIDGSQLADAFENADGTLTYQPATGGRSSTFDFSFSDDDWTATWLLHTQAKDLNGTISYQWQGKPSKRLWKKNHTSGTKTTNSNTIVLSEDD